MEIQANGDVEYGIRLLQRAVKRDNTLALIAFRLRYVKPSERRAAKRRKAELRRRKIEARDRQSGKNGTDTQTNCQYRFVRVDGQYVKVPSKREEMHQAIRKA
jgi:ribosomal protein S21